MSSNLSEISNSFEDLAETSHNDENVATMSSLNLHDYEVESDSTESEQEPDTSEDEAPDHQDLLSDGDEEKRYGYNHAPFFAGSLEEAIEESFVAPGRPENDRKPLAIYLHSDDKAASASNVFPEKILCSEKVSSLLSKQYVTWPFDMTLEHHQEVFYELISNTVCAEIKDEIQQIPIANYPLLVIVVQEKYPAFACIFVQGHDTESEAVENLLVGLDHFAANKTRAKENLYETRERQSLLNVWLEAQRKQNYCNSKDEKDVATEIDIIKKALVPDVKYFSDYQRPDVTSAGSGDAEYQFSVPSSDSEPSVAEAHARFKKSNVTTFTLPEPTDVESFTDISKFTVDVRAIL
uniref:UAS domain-containing protein n=1 Tax=Ditylenchus dipsaci TaxID=166011 RepID=A0A915CQ78_9BILA